MAFCSECNKERGCGCGFKKHPLKDISICSDCYSLISSQLNNTKQNNEQLPANTNQTPVQVQQNDV